MDLLTKTIENIKPLDKEAMAQARKRQDELTKPAGSLGRLEKLSIQIAGIQRKARPQIKNKAMITMAADHGVVDEKVGNWPREVTAQMVENFLRGGAGINVLARQAGARIVFVDMGVASDLKPNKQLIVKKVDYGTKNICQGPAMTGEQAVKAIEAGIEIVNGEAKNGTGYRRHRRYGHREHDRQQRRLRRPIRQDGGRNDRAGNRVKRRAARP